MPRPRHGPTTLGFQNLNFVLVGPQPAAAPAVIDIGSCKVGAATGSGPTLYGTTSMTSHPGLMQGAVGSSLTGISVD